MEYKVAYGYDRQNLADSVNYNLTRGWKLREEMVVGGNGEYFYQVMIREGESSGEELRR